MQSCRFSGLLIWRKKTDEAGGETPAFFIARVHPTSGTQPFTFGHVGAKSLYFFFVVSPLWSSPLHE